MVAMQNRTIAVTGATGLIGSHLLPVLLGKGYQLRVLSRHVQKDRPGITQIQGDIRCASAVRNMMRGSDAVIHLAGVAHASLRSQKEIEEAEQINVGGTRSVLAAAENAGVERILLVSSAHVYAGQEGTELDEQSPTACDSFYSRTKLIVEQAALEAASANRLAAVIVRPCLTYGPGVRFNLESLMRAIQGHYYFHIRGENPMRSFLSAGNAAKAITHLLQSGENGRIYNLADQTPMPLVEFVNSLADLMHVSRPIHLPLFAIRAAIVGAAPLQRMGLRLPVSQEALRKLTTSFSLDVKALASTGFQWLDDGLATRKRMVDVYLASREHGPVT